MPEPMRTSLHPLTHVQAQIQSAHIREAFDRMIGDRCSPNEATPAEIDAFFRAATHNDPSVRGHDLTATELADLQMIRREGGAYLLQSQAAAMAYDAKLGAYQAKPKVTIADTDPSIQVSSVAVNKVAIKGVANGDLCPSGVMCVIGGPSTVTVDVGGERFAVQPQPKERASSVAKRLAEELAEGGYRASVRTYGGRTIVTINGPSGVEPTRPTYAEGAYAQLKGRLLEGNADDSSKKLKLDQKIKVGDVVTDEIDVPFATGFPAGQATLSGQLKVGYRQPMEIHHPVIEVRLLGVSDIGRGEPRYDGKDWINTLGKKCDALRYDRPAEDDPLVLFVVDQSADKVFIGSWGGSPFAPPEAPVNQHPFHGFHSSMNLRNPTRYDMGQIIFRAPNDTPGGRAREEWPHSRATGKPLVEVSDEQGVVGKRWFYDPDASKLYHLDVTGPTTREFLHVGFKDGRDV